VMIDRYGDRDLQAYFAVYDGHGGREVVEFVAEHLHEFILEELKKDPNKPLEAFENGYAKTEEQIEVRKIQKSGCTAVSALIIGPTLYIANIGDTNAILMRKGEPMVLTVEHNAAKNEKEVKRVTEMGSMVIGGKLAGILSVTRAFGDLDMKPYLIADPHMKKVTLTPDDDVLVLACDGLWDVVTFQECADIINKEMKEGQKSASTMANVLVQTALEKKSTDNISVLVILLNQGEGVGYANLSDLAE